MDELLVRGPQPEVQHLCELAGQGLRSVFNLREETQRTREACRQAGLIYYHIPVLDWSVPEQGQVEEFLELLQEPCNQAALVHCWGGVGRTGMFVSCYRVTQGMEVEAALRLSDEETPHMVMSAEQRDWVRSWVRGPK